MPIETDWTEAAAAVPTSGMRFVRAATAAELQALAATLNILSCTALTCELRIRPLRQGRFQVAGTIDAAVVQACIVSVEPVAAKLTETVDVEFWPADQIASPASTAVDEWFDPQAPDEAEPIVQGRLRLGQLIYETIAAGLEPYPRAPGAELERTSTKDRQADVHPFAALAKLKRPE
jgi:uncharacterized metal-binding protein YceD (DUF177 family)